MVALEERQMTKKQKQLDEARIDRIFGLRCSGVQIPVMELGKIFRVGQAGIALGMNDDALGDAIAAAADAVRVK